MRLQTYIKEAKKKKGGIPKAKGKKYSFAEKNDPDGWYQNPGMMGEVWAKEGLDRVEGILNTYSKSKLQKWVIAQIWGTPQEIKTKKFSWHTFSTHYTKKDAMLLQYTLRRVDKFQKTGMAALLYDVSKKKGVLKDELSWALEHLAYKFDKEAYMQEYIRNMGWYGMDPDEAEKRFESYHKSLIGKHIKAYK